MASSIGPAHHQVKPKNLKPKPLHIFLKHGKNLAKKKTQNGVLLPSDFSREIKVREELDSSPQPLFQVKRSFPASLSRVNTLE